MNLDALEARLGIIFKNKDLIREALTHRSYLNETHNWPLPHNERLEFLGDAVLELIVTEKLYNDFPTYPEGKLTVLRSALVNYQIMARIAQGLELQKYMLMSRGEKIDSSKAKEVILANALEAVIGAIYMDQGYEASRIFIEHFIINHLQEILQTKSYRDAKSELQEIAQEQHKITPSYRVLDESGPAHNKIFRMGVFFGESLMAEGVGSSKQEAEVQAAKEALKKVLG